MNNHTEVTDVKCLTCVRLLDHKLWVCRELSCCQSLLQLVEIIITLLASYPLLSICLETLKKGSTCKPLHNRIPNITKSIFRAFVAVSNVTPSVAQLSVRTLQVLSPLKNNVTKVGVHGRECHCCEFWVSRGTPDLNRVLGEPDI